MSWRRTVLWALLHPREAAALAWDIVELEAEAQSLTVVHRVFPVVVDRRGECGERGERSDPERKRWN